MKMTDTLKGRFCNDLKLCIKIFDEPYFTERLQLFNKIYNVNEAWELFQREVEQFGGEQNYLTEYNKVKDNAIDFIKAQEAYKRFNTINMDDFALRYKDLTGKEIYKPSNHKRTFISVDIVKANFSCLRYYDKSIVGNCKTWEEFISKFTTSNHIKNSKYIRQVIFGNCNCNRHITFEKHIMGIILSIMNEKFNILDRVVFFSNDEVVFDVTDMSVEKLSKLRERIDEYTLNAAVPLRSELFNLYKIDGADGYVKIVMNKDRTTTPVFKGVNSFTSPFVFRAFLGEEIQESDRVFVHEKMIAKFIDTPDIKFDEDMMYLCRSGSII